MMDCMSCCIGLKHFHVQRVDVLQVIKFETKLQYSSFLGFFFFLLVVCSSL